MKPRTFPSVAPPVGIIMGSNSDWKTMRHAASVLDSVGIEFEQYVVSAHRTPEDMIEYATKAECRGLQLIIAGAGGAAHLPGMVASMTITPVIGVPVDATPLNALDALLSIMQMPAEVGVATVNVGVKGAFHAGIFAATLLALHDQALYPGLRGKREDMLRDAKVRQVKAGRPSTPRVAILAESETDFEILRHAEDQFSTLTIPSSRRLMDPDATPEEVLAQIEQEEREGAVAFIAGSGCGVRLARRVAQATMLPVLGVPLVSGKVGNLDEFLQPFLEMPSGVATFAVGKPGAINAALFAATILSKPGSDTRKKLQDKREAQKDKVRKMKLD